MHSFLAYTKFLCSCREIIPYIFLHETSNGAHLNYNTHMLRVWYNKQGAKVECIEHSFECCTLPTRSPIFALAGHPCVVPWKAKDE